MLSTELPKKSFANKLHLLLWIKIIWSSCMGYQTFINRILLSEIFLNTHSCNLVKIQVSFLDSLYRNQFSVKQILFQKFCLPQKFLSYLKAGKNPNVKLINCRLLEPKKNLPLLDSNMSLLIRTIFPLQYIEKTHSLTLALTKTAF